MIGLGYVGLPLAVEFGKKFPTLGFDIDESRIKELKAGRDHTNEASSEELASARQLSFSTDATPDPVTLETEKLDAACAVQSFRSRPCSTHDRTDARAPSHRGGHARAHTACTTSSEAALTALSAQWRSVALSLSGDCSRPAGQVCSRQGSRDSRWSTRTLPRTARPGDDQEGSPHHPIGEKK